MEFDGTVIGSIMNAPMALAELWSLADKLASFTAPMPPQAALAALLFAVLRLMLDVAAREASGLLSNDARTDRKGTA